ncbi:hypothetical protein F8388_005904 [Cannabis sativa]|uniref:Uncharacterized protein n=1 Tax=Cannabis sativa TaxID=3483 RepID=A0A7J6HIL7_CANSA|nr:hypothetical protein F8388_005904 [Cannabis sativa]
MGRPTHSQTIIGTSYRRILGATLPTVDSYFSPSDYLVVGTPMLTSFNKAFQKKKGIILNTQHFPGGEDCYFSS